MRSWISTFVVGVSVLGLADVSAAQDRFSQRERDYAAELARSLGQQPGQVERVQYAHAPVDLVNDGMITRPIAGPGFAPPPAAPPPATPMVNGLSVRMNDVTVERLRFESPEQAQEHAAWLVNGELDTKRPVTVEVRGNQLVRIQGDAVNDPAAVKLMTESAWNGLPAPPGAPDVAFTGLEDGSFALSTTLKDGPLRDLVDKGLEAAHERQQRPDPDNSGMTIATTPTTARVGFPSGFLAELQSDAQGASATTAPSPEAEAKIKDHLAALGGHPGSTPAPGAASATEGAAKVLEDLFR